MLILHIYGLNQTSFLHIRSLEGTALANKIYNEQRKEGWPGLAKETKEICEGLNITDVNTTYLTKNIYKLLVDGAIKRKNEEWLRKEAEGKRKCEKNHERDIWKKELHHQKQSWRSQKHIQS